MPFALDLSVPPRTSRSLVRDLHRQLREAIVSGRLLPGTQIPSSRAFAVQYGVSRSTAITVYDLLLSEGFLTARQGAGTFVADTLRSTSKARTTHRRRRDARLPPHVGIDAEFGSADSGPFEYDLRLGLPDKSAFPFDIWRRLSNRALRILRSQPPAYLDPAGPTAYCRAIRAHVSFARAVACNERNIVATTGAQQAFDLIARSLVEPGNTIVAVEDPGYPPLRAIFSLAGAQIRPIPVDAEGIIVDRLPKKTKIICVTPSHQFPTGVVMSLERRNALLDFAVRNDAVVVEDDYDGEFRFGGNPVDALQTLDRDDSVFYVGTFSKSLFPALRLGFVVAPDWARKTIVTMKKLTDWHGPALPQLTLAAFIEEGHLTRYVRRMRKIYSKRHEALHAGLSEQCGQWLTPIPAAAGLHLAAVVHGDLNAENLVARCASEGVRVENLGMYSLRERGPQGFALGYGMCPYEKIGEAIARIAIAAAKESGTAATTY